MSQPAAPWPQPGNLPSAQPPKKDGSIAIVVIVGVVFAGMMIVAVVGILAAIAIPNFIRFQQRSKAAEAMTNVRSIAMLELAEFAANEQFVDAGPVPSGTPGRERRPFEPDAGFRKLQWNPGMSLYYQYEVRVGPDGKSATVIARGDLDGDGEVGEYSMALEGPNLGELKRPPGSVF